MIEGKEAHHVQPRGWSTYGSLASDLKNGRNNGRGMFLPLYSTLVIGIPKRSGQGMSELILPYLDPGNDLINPSFYMQHNPC
jgi:hypothetical protein